METFKMGPIGSRDSSDRSKEWDEMGHNVISYIIVSYDMCGLRSIQFGYVDNGALVMSKTYGASLDGYSSRIVRLKHESEFVTGLSGEVYNGFITSLTFHTNLRKHEVVHLAIESKGQGPQKMELHPGILERREFGGFFGTYCKYKINLMSIGMYAVTEFKKIKHMMKITE